MKSALLTAISLLAAAVHGSVVEPRCTDGSNGSNGTHGSDGYVQNPSGTASFTQYSGCGNTACGIPVSGFSAAISQLAFGSDPGLGAGDGCGRCMLLTGEQDPYSPNFNGPFKSIVVKVTDMCPAKGNEVFCNQTPQNPVNTFGQSVHFDLCMESGAAGAFFPSGHDALTGTYQEVLCSEWVGTDGQPQWDHACLKGEKAPFWPGASGCGNQGTPP